MRLCIEPYEQESYIMEAHVGLCGWHFAKNQTEQRLKRMGVYWPTMSGDIHQFISNCAKCQATKPINHSTLFRIAIAPEWGRYMVDYLSTRILPKDILKARKKAIETEAQSYALIGGQLYKRGPDENLRICAAENEYITILEQAHKGLAGGHFSAETTAKCILAAGIWWPTLNLDAEVYNTIFVNMGISQFPYFEY